MNQHQYDVWLAAVAKRDFSAFTEDQRDELIANSLFNAEDVPDDEQLDVAIATMDQYIDDGVSTY